MFKPKKLLKVVSIIIIVFGVLSLFSIGYSYFVVQNMDIPGTYITAVKEALTPLNMVISIVSVLIFIVSGILGLMGKSWKACVGLMGIYLVITIITTIQSAMQVGVNFTIVFNFLIPVLYLWGVYQSKE